EEVDRLGFLEKVQCGTVDLSVLIHIEVVGTEEVGDPDDGVAVEHQRAQHGRLRFEVVWGNAPAGHSRRGGAEVDPQALVTISGMRAVTSLCSLTWLAAGPMARMGSGNSILRRSSVIPCCCFSAEAATSLLSPALPVPLTSSSRTIFTASYRKPAPSLPPGAGPLPHRFPAMPDVLVESAGPEGDPLLVLVDHLFGGSVDEHLDRQNSQCQRIHLAQHRKPQWEVDHRVVDRDQGSGQGNLVLLGNP